MSSPAASWALITQATASRYCSRKIESPSADLNDRPCRLSVNQSGRGYDPVIAVASGRSRVTLSSSRPPGERTAQQLSRECPGVLAVAQEHLAVDDRGGDAARALDEPPRARRKIVDDFRHLRDDRLGIEDDEIGGHPLTNQAAVVEAPERRRHQRQHAHRLLQRERLLRPDPVVE